MTQGELTDVNAVAKCKVLIQLVYLVFFSVELNSYIPLSGHLTVLVSRIHTQNYSVILSFWHMTEEVSTFPI